MLAACCENEVMEVLQEGVPARRSPARAFKALLLNFKKLHADPPPSSSPLHAASATTPASRHTGKKAAASLSQEYSWEDLLHAVAGLCSVALPDMEESAIYSSLTRSGSKTVVLLLTSEEQSTEQQPQNPQRHKPRRAATVVSSTDSRDSTKTTTDAAGVQCASGSGDSSELENPFLEVFSASDSSDNESAGGEDEFSEGRRRFLEACRHRHSGQQSRLGPEDVVAGCGCFLRLSDRPLGSAVQVLLLAVRHRWRKVGLGSFLLQTMKDPAVVGEYDALLTFADRKAERFFSTHGFSDDPILTAKYRGMVDDWENSSLMVYTPPFSGSSIGSSGSSMASLSLCEDSYKSWRELAISSYCEQLSLMQRLRHEVVLLHSKLESREAEIEMLKRQLEEVKREKSVVELEFSDYRKHTQKRLCDAAVDKTQHWLDSLSSN